MTLGNLNGLGINPDDREQRRAFFVGHPGDMRQSDPVQLCVFEVQRMFAESSEEFVGFLSLDTLGFRDRGESALCFHTSI